MSVANTALLYNLGFDGYFVSDDLAAGAAGVRGTALRLPSQVNRITTSPSNGACILPSILSGEAARVVFVVNDSANTIVVGAAAPGGGGATQETINGTTTNAAFSTGTLSIPTGQSGVFIPVPNAKGTTLDWRAAVIP